MAVAKTATCLLARVLALTSSSRLTSSLSQSARLFPHSLSGWVADLKPYRPTGEVRTWPPTQLALRDTTAP